MEVTLYLVPPLVTVAGIVIDLVEVLFAPVTATVLDAVILYLRLPFVNS